MSNFFGIKLKREIIAFITVSQRWMLPLMTELSSVIVLKDTRRGNGSVTGNII